MNYKSNRKAVDGMLKASELAALTAIGEFVEGAAKLNAAVDTGNLRDSMGYRVNDSDKSVTIGNSADYSVWLETGTSKAPAQPFLRPAAESNLKVIKSLVQGAWKA